LTQSQFSADRREQATANPLSWHVPVRATAGGAVARVVTEARTTQLSVPGCGPLLVNAGQTGYYRTLYTPPQAAALTGVFPQLGPVDEYGLIADSMALSRAGYQPMLIGLNFLDAMPAIGNAQVVQNVIGEWDDLYDLLDGDPAAQTGIAQRVVGKFGPRLQQLGFAPKAGEPVADAVLRPTLIDALGKYRDPAVLAEAARLFAAWKQDPNAIPGSLKTSWLRMIARNADAATWDAIHQRARATNGSIERTELYELLGRAENEALAKRALDLALTNEPGKTTSSGIISTVAAQHPRLAIDFVLAHLDQVNQLIDISGRSSFMRRLAYGSHDPALIPILENYAKANLAASDRKPIDQVIDRIRSQSSQMQRIQAETDQWLQAHPQG
jgi:aminopeptidase N